MNHPEDQQNRHNPMISIVTFGLPSRQSKLEKGQQASTHGCSQLFCQMDVYINYSRKYFKDYPGPCLLTRYAIKGTYMLHAPPTNVGFDLIKIAAHVFLLLVPPP
mmetsp:Transcript_34258/g.71317  ORF Transcript_34258/g.71317 Transcript_34258/m.71317 type:complete len:105 (+) Transcript_34258:1467-1781(+)